MTLEEKAEAIVAVGRRMSKHWRTTSQLEEIRFATEYAEPGYSTSKELIAFGNWNKVTEWRENTSVTVDDTMARIADAFEAIGIELEWSDEWEFCNDCGGAIRTSPNSYGWQPAYVCDADGFVCEDCLTSSKRRSRSYLEELEGAEEQVRYDQPRSVGLRLQTVRRRVRERVPRRPSGEPGEDRQGPREAGDLPLLVHA